MYVAEWEILADALKRVHANGLDAEQAKEQIGWAIADRKIELRVHCVNGCDLEGNDIDVPKRLSPEDFDWSQSRPWKPWRRRPTIADHYLDEDVTIEVSLIELRKMDVTRIFCLTGGIGAATAPASTGSADARATTTSEVFRNTEPLVPEFYPADALHPASSAPHGFFTLRGAIRMIVEGQHPECLVVLSRAYSDAFFAQVTIGQAAQMKQRTDDQAALWRVLHDHPLSIASRHHEASKRGLATIWSATAERLWQAIAYGTLPLMVEAGDGRLVQLPPLALKENALETVLNRDQVAWFDPNAPRQPGVGRPLVAEADVLRWLDGGALVDGPAAMPSASKLAVEPSRASARLPIMQVSDSPPNWEPLMDALEWADSTLGADAWGLMKEWNQAGELSMCGRADEITQVFQCHWFDFPAWWGPAADTEGDIPSSDRPRRSRLDHCIATRLAPRPSRSSSDDILWFDQSTASAKGVGVPRTVSNVLVDMTALRRLIRARLLGGANEAPMPSTTPDLRKATEAKIHEAISAIYDHAKAQGMMPPNLHDIARHVLPRLQRGGLTATKRRIQDLAGDPRHARRRRKAGPRVYGTLLPFSDLEM